MIVEVGVGAFGVDAVGACTSAEPLPQLGMIAVRRRSIGSARSRFTESNNTVWLPLLTSGDVLTSLNN